MFFDHQAASFISRLSNTPPKNLLFIGGLPRSGTSSLERYLHGFENIFVTDECAAINDNGYIETFNMLSQYGKDEVALWNDENHRGWRGFSQDDLELARLASFISTFMYYTRRNKFQLKTPQKINCIGFKYPGIENKINIIRNSFETSITEVLFIYCARDPVMVLKSNWQMPWTKYTDPYDFAKYIANYYEISMSQFIDIKARKMVWKTDLWRDKNSENIKLLNSFIELGSRQDGSSVIDEWPLYRRRSIKDIPNDVVKFFSDLPPIQEYRNYFKINNL